MIVSGVDEDGRVKYDLLSSSLAQAQIDLDPYQFIENAGQHVKAVEKSGSGMFLVLQLNMIFVI